MTIKSAPETIAEALRRAYQGRLDAAAAARVRVRDKRRVKAPPPSVPMSAIVSGPLVPEPNIDGEHELALWVDQFVTLVAEWESVARGLVSVATGLANDLEVAKATIDTLRLELEKR